jgi:DNA-binding CsgD family transcriptional regulator
MRGLTPRQREIIALVAAGRTNQEIGRALGISYQTVKNHLWYVSTLHGHVNRAQLAVWWVTEGRAQPVEDRRRHWTQYEHVRRKDVRTDEHTTHRRI